MRETTDTLPPMPQPAVLTGRNSVLYVGGLPADTNTAFTADQMREYALAAIQQERERVTKLAEHYAQGMRALSNETAAEAAMACSRLAASGYPGAAAIRSQE